MRWQRVIDYAVYLVVRIVICIVQALPLDTCQRLIRPLAALFSDVLGIRHEITDQNLACAYPHLTARQRRRLARKMWEHLFLMVVEIAHAPRKIHVTNWHQHIHFVDDATIVRAMLDDRPAVLVSGHYGNFELGGYVLGVFDFATYAVARPLDNPYLDQFVNRFRRATGQFLLPKGGSAAQIARLLGRGATLAVLGDQAAGDKGCWINFFGRPASAHKAIAVFSLSHQGPLLVTYARRLGRPLVYEMGVAALADPLDPGYKLDTIPALTQWYSDRLEEIINRAPEQYWWLHRRWKGKPGRRGRKNKAA